MIRGAAAIAVLLGHVRGLFFQPYHELAHRGIALAAVYALTSLGHQAVIVFFVLSGFFIVSSILEALEKRQWAWIVYLVNRVVRLSLVLVPALLLSGLADGIGMAMKESTAFYRQPLAYYFSVSPACLYTVRNFFGSLFYLQGILAHPFGSNGPLWSLSYEFWYYMLFPLVLSAFIKRYRPGVRISYLALAALVAWFIGQTIALYFLLWLMGGAVAWAFGREGEALWNRAVSAAALLVFVAALALSVTHYIRPAFFRDAIVALGFGVLMYALVRSPNRALPHAYTIASRRSAGFSYTLYATHFPLLFLLRARLIGRHVWRPDWLHFFYGLMIAAVMMAIAWAIAQATEAKTAGVRKIVMNYLPHTIRTATVRSG